MANDIASLGIEVKTDSVKTAADDLDRLNQAGAQTEQAATRAGNAWTQAASKMSQAGAPAERMSKSFGQGTEEIKSQQQELAKLLGKIDPVVGALGRLDAMEEQLRKHASTGLLPKDDFDEYAKKIQAMRDGLAGSDEQLKKTGVSAAQTAAALRMLPAQFTDIFTQLAGGANPLLVLIQQGGQIKDSFGGIGNTFDVLGGKVKSFFGSLTGFNTAGVTALGGALSEIAKQQENIAENSDSAIDGISGTAESVNNLSEAADTVKGAATGVTSSTAAMVGGFLAAAAALAALAAAYKQGSDEQTAYAKALILTGNAAGVTTDQLADLARQVGSETGTIHDAADALTQFAATGKFASSQLGELATAALNFEDATGKAVSETVKEFARLADDPVKASQQLNEQYHYLTAAVYEQIAALQEQGRTNDAAQVAEKAYAEALDDRATKVKESLGTIETAWKNIKEGAASAWDAMLGVGREQTPQQRLEELNKPAGFDQKGFFSSGAMFGPLGALYNSYKQFDAATTPEDDRRQEKAFLEQQLSTKEAIAKAEALYREEQDKGIEAQREVDSIEKQFLTNAEKRNKEIKEYRRQLDDIRKANPNDARLDEDRIAKNIANIEAKYKDPKAPKTPKTKAYQDDEATRLLLSLQQQEASLSEQLNIDTKLSESKKQQIKFEQLIADLKTKDILTADQKSLLANQDAISAQLEKNSQLDAEITKRKELLKLQSFKGGLDQTLQSDAQGYEEQRSGEGLGKLQRQELRDRLRIQRDYQRQVFQLQTQQGNISQDLMDKESKALEENLNKRLDLNKEYYDKLAKDQGSFSKGASDAFSEFLDNARDIAGSTKNIIGDVLNGFTQGVGDSIGRAVVQGDNLQESLAGVAETISTQLISALVQLGIQYAVNATLGQSAAAAATATSASMAAATATAWAPAAALASLASFGSNAAPAAAAITGTATLAESIAATSSLGAFKDGGYTGSGNPFDVAGVVHKGEYVMTADTVNRLGVNNLDAIQKGRAIASAVPAANDPTMGLAGRSGSTPRSNVTNINVNVHGIRDSVDLRQASAKVARDVTGAFSHAERYS